jgi:hypothetical protein
MSPLQRTKGKIALLIGALMIGVFITYLAHTLSPFIPGLSVIIAALPFFLAGTVGVVKNTTV